MSLFELILVVTTLLCGLIAGFLFAFALVVMPGIAKLSDKSYIRAFQVIDGVIQAGQPVFGIVWLGSIVGVLLATLLSVLQHDTVMQMLVIASAFAYIAGVLLPTFRVNVPLNNVLQSIDTTTADQSTLAASRSAFETQWVK
jgi:uncharacterized membrane protein